MTARRPLTLLMNRCNWVFKPAPAKVGSEVKARWKRGGSEVEVRCGENWRNEKSPRGREKIFQKVDPFVFVMIFQIVFLTYDGSCKFWNFSAYTRFMKLLNYYSRVFWRLMCSQ